MQRKSLLLLFFLTGISSLIYEIAWVRQATLTFGVSIYAYSAVLAAYMGGMALGAAWLGPRADRTPRPLRLFALLQVALALLGSLTPLALRGMTGLYALMARGMSPDLGVLTLVRLMLAILVLVPPSLFIGALFPVMSRLYARQVGEVGRDLGWMYAVNTLGSVLGCLVTAVLLIRLLGTQGTVIAAGLLNLLAAGLSALMAEGTDQPAPVRKAQKPAQARPAAEARRRHANRPDEARPAEASRQADPPRGSSTAARARAEAALPPAALRFLLWAYALSGLVSLAYEVVWARIIGLFTVGAVYSFSIMLAVFLSGLVVGGLLGGWWVRRRSASLRAFGALELGIGLLAVLALFAFAQLPRLSIEDLFGGYSIPAEMAFEGLLSFITLFPVTVLIGAAFPVASSLYTAEQAEGVGGKIARLSALNTAGSILGSLLAGFVILPLLGIRGSVLLLAAINLAIGAAAVLLFEKVSSSAAAAAASPAAAASQAAAPSPTRLRSGLLAGGALLAAVLAGALLPQTPFLGYWQNKAGQVIFYREGIETTVAVFDQSADNPKFSTVNGRIEVPTDVLSMRAFYLLGHLPPLLNPQAKNALMLSFGNGIASGALATHQVPSIDVVDLSPEMVEAAATVYKTENRDVTGYPGLKVHIEDARNFLLQTNRTFDIITTDATHPSNSSSWTLFTQEFYQQVQQHLSPEGVFLQWIPIHNLTIRDYQTILRTYQSVFPNATLWYTGGSHTLLLATPQPITKEALAVKLSAETLNPAVLQDLGAADRITRHLVMSAEDLRAFVGPGRIAHDDNAFFLPDNTEMDALTQLMIQAAMRANPQP